jgi:hypothetical protein
MAKTKFGRGSISDLIKKAEAVEATEATEVTEVATPTQSASPVEHPTPPPVTAPVQAAQVAKDVVLLPVSMDGIFSVENTYKNAKKQVCIAEGYRDFIGLFAELFKMDMSQIVNNMLRPYFTDEAILKQLKVLGKKKQKERMKMLEEG